MKIPDRPIPPPPRELKDDSIGDGFAFLPLAVIVLAICMLFGGCATSLDDAVGIAPGVNAVQCIHLASVLDGITIDGNAEVSRLEFPSELDVSTLTPELVTAIANLAERMGCANGSPDN